MSERSKYVRLHRRRLPREKRTIRLEGSSEDSNKWFKCWYCGFHVNADKSEIGDGSGVNTVLYNDAVDNYDIQDYGQSDKMQHLTLDGCIHFETVVKPTAEGTVASMKLPYKSDISSGCPFCGSKNYR